MLAVGRREARRAGAKIALAASSRSGAKWPLINPRLEHAVGGDRDAERATGRQDRGLDPARDQRVLDLQIADRMRRGGAADRLGADLGEADVAHVARLDELGDRADGLLDRHVGIEASGTVDVDVLDSEAVSEWASAVLTAGGLASYPSQAPSGPRWAPNFTLSR